MAVTFSKRQGGYKAGVCMLLVGVVVFCVGFATPYWNVAYKESSYGSWSSNSGLWMSCARKYSYKDTDLCVSHHLIEMPEYFKAIQGMQCVSLISSLAALIYFFLVNFVNNNNTISIARAGELTAGLGGVLGLIGLIVYGVKHGEDTQKGKLVQLVNSSHLSWSFFVDLVGLLLIFVAAVVVGVSNKPCRLDDMAMRYIPAQQTVVVPYPGQTAVNIPVCITAATGNPVFTGYPAASHSGYAKAPQP